MQRRAIETSDRTVTPLPAPGIWAVLILAVAALSMLSRASEIPFTLLAMAAPWLCWRLSVRPWRDPVLRLLLFLFACYWLPMLLALPDALDAPKSLLQTLTALRLPLAATSIILVLRHALPANRFYPWLAGLILFWAIDALVQQLAGFNLLGMADDYPRLSGVFADQYLRLGLYCALLLPFLLHCLSHALSGRTAAVVAWVFGALLVIAVIWLSGTRSAWIMAALALAVWLGSHWRRRWWPAVALSGAMLMLTMIASYHWLPPVQQRLHQTAQLLSGDQAAIDHALSFRLPIWRHALAMIGDHPLNGVGPRGFRAAYEQRARADDYFLNNDGIGASHAHQLQLSILTETGLIGLLGFILGSLAVWRHWRGLEHSQRQRAAAPALALLLAVFPFNSHLDAYASSPALLFWWLLALYLGAAQQPQPDAR
ncbi:MAG: O-antigen ligase [Wenzhouxiangellaceae bacterium]